MFKIRLESRTVLPLPLASSKTIRSGTFGTYACLDCSGEYSFRLIGLVSKLSCLIIVAKYLVKRESNFYLEISEI